jgi:hypothetical protein
LHFIKRWFVKIILWFILNWKDWSWVSFNK